MELLHYIHNRYISFIVFAGLSLAILGLDAHIILTSPEGYVPTYTKLSATTAALTLIFMIPFSILDYTRGDYIGPVMGYETLLLCPLWVLWIIAFNKIAKHSPCDFLSLPTSSFCSEIRVVELFSFFLFLALLAYWLVVLVVSSLAFLFGNEDVFPWSNLARQAARNGHTQPSPPRGSLSGEKRKSSGKENEDMSE